MDTPQNTTVIMQVLSLIYPSFLFKTSIHEAKVNTKISVFNHIKGLVGNIIFVISTSLEIAGLDCEIGFLNNKIYRVLSTYRYRCCGVTVTDLSLSLYTQGYNVLSKPGGGRPIQNRLPRFPVVPTLYFGG